MEMLPGRKPVWQEGQSSQDSDFFCFGKKICSMWIQSSFLLQNIQGLF